MLTLSSCPQCRHIFPVPNTTSVNTTMSSLPFSDESHRCFTSGQDQQQQLYDNNSSDFNDEYFDWTEEDSSYDCMEDNTDDGDTLVTFREHVSTKRPISNRLSLCGGGLITINQEVEPIEPITPLEDCYNPLRFFGNPAYRSEQQQNLQSSNNLKRNHHRPETLPKYRNGMSDDGCRSRDARWESKIHVTTADSSQQISPSTPLTFVLPISTGCQARPVSHILMTQKSEVAPTISDFRVVYPAQNVNTTGIRPLSLQFNYDSSQPCILVNQKVNTTNLYLLPWQRQESTHLDSQSELDRLEILARRLNSSCWYYDSMTWQKSEDLLKCSAPGTFLVRNSSDPNYLYSLSVQTRNGPTSIRLSYVNGAFCLDSQQNLQQSMPKFPCIIRLIEHYIHFTLLQEKRDSHKADPEIKKKIGNKVWMDSNGSIHSEIVLKRPLYKQVPSLKHLSRLKIHEAINSNGQPKLPLLPGYALLDLPKILVEYLAEYPYAH